MRRLIIAALCITMSVFALAACSSSSKSESSDSSPGTTDEMYSDYQSDAVIEVFVRDGRVYTVEYEYEIPELAGYDELQEGKHYKLTADVTFLNGGVAGYVDYPQIDRVIKIDEIPSGDEKSA